MVKNPTVLTDAAHADWAEYKRLTERDGWRYERATVIWGKAYWWLRRGMSEWKLVASPLRDVTDADLLDLARELGLPVDEPS